MTPIHPESYWAGVASSPDAIVADAGSGDIGPSYLGADAQYAPREWEKHDLRLMLTASRSLGCPMIVGSAGGAGTNSAVDRYVELVHEIAREEGLSGFRIARINAEIDRAWLASRAASERLEGLGAPEPLTSDEVLGAARVVAMMGVDPLVEALEGGADVIIAGRSCDDALFAAVPIQRGFDKGLSLHLGKTIECGPLVATPILARETVVATIRGDDFLVEPFHPRQRCTPASVAGHTLYERLDPYTMAVPGGLVDMHDVAFEAYTDRICLVRGSRWVPDPQYKVKLEGATYLGHRVYFLFGLRDAASIANLDNILQSIRTEVESVVGCLSDGSRHLLFHAYGKNAIMGAREPVQRSQSHEIAVVAEVVSPDQDEAMRMAKLVKYMSLRADYPGKTNTAGGAALLNDEVLPTQHAAYRWSIDHLLPLTSPREVFPLEYEDV